MDKRRKEFMFVGIEDYLPIFIGERRIIFPEGTKVIGMHVDQQRDGVVLRLQHKDFAVIQDGVIPYEGEVIYDHNDMYYKPHAKGIK